MSLTVSDNLLLVSPDEVGAMALSSLSVDTTEFADTNALLLWVSVAQERVANFLSRHLFVSRFAFYPAETHAPGWSFSAQRSAYGVWLPEWPLVEIEGDFEVGESRPGGQRVWAQEPTDKVEFYAGYRGLSHSLEDLQDIEGLEDLDTLPEELPHALRQGIVELTLLYLGAAKNGTIGVGSVTQQIGSQSNVTVESVDRQAESRILRRMRAYQRVV